MDRCSCFHLNIHPARFDGTHSYCLDCKTQVTIVPFVYASGMSREVQSKEAFARLEALRLAGKSHE